MLSFALYSSGKLDTTRTYIRLSILGGVHGTHTTYNEIVRIDRGCYVRIDPNGEITNHKFWEPQYRPNFTMEDLISIAREYQISDVKSALFLSGGVDSSFLACIYDDLDCFHLTSPEEIYAKMVATRFGRHVGNHFCSVHRDTFDSIAILSKHHAALQLRRGIVTLSDGL